MPKVRVAPSLLAADPMNFATELRSVEEAGADWHHVDVMDGHFVPNLTYGIPFVKALKKTTKIPLDVHIMVSNPDTVALQYVEAGADLLSFHIEAAVHSHRLLHAIRAAGAKAGLSVNPGTPFSIIEPLLSDVDLVNVMSVNPGFGGQKFIPQIVDKIQRIDQGLKDLGRRDDVFIEVDGGINAETGRVVVDAGADFLVAGTYVYGAEDRSQPISKLHALGS